MADLKQQISLLYDMELNNYLMTRAMSQLNNKYHKLGKKHSIYEPHETRRENFKLNLAFIFGGCIGIPLGLIIGIISGIKDKDGFFFTIVFTLIYIAACFIVLFLIGAVADIFATANKNKKNKEKYERDLQKYKQSLADDARRVQIEKKQKDVVAKEYHLLKGKLEESQAKLQTFYNRAGIDAAYRNLVPIGYMNEFLRLGISNTLGGANGLYYLVRKELRYDFFNLQLQEISNKLDVIIDQNKAIYAELTSINSKCDRLIDLSLRQMQDTAQMNRSIDEIARNSSVSAYYSERCARELEYARYFGNL